MLPKPKIDKFAVVAKHKIYFADVKSQFQTYPINFDYFNDLEELVEAKSNAEYKYIFFLHYSKIVPQKILDSYKCIGFHTGDLPNDRGGSPIQNKIISGEYKTKISAFQMTKDLDGGPVLCNRDIDLEFGNIEVIIAQISKLISEMIHEIIFTNPVPVPQLNIGKLHKRLTSKDSIMNIDELSLKQIYDKIRMLDGLNYPPAFLETSSYRLFFSNPTNTENGITCSVQIEEIASD